ARARRARPFRRRRRRGAHHRRRAARGARRGVRSGSRLRDRRGHERPDGGARGHAPYGERYGVRELHRIRHAPAPHPHRPRAARCPLARSGPGRADRLGPGCRTGALPLSHRRQQTRVRARAHALRGRALDEPGGGNMVSGRLRRPPMRRRAPGAAVFVVVMAITLLTAVGLFAAHSATLVDQASGHARLARQTVSLAEYGTLAAAAELGSGAADAYVAELSARTEQCRANVGRLTENPPCYKLFLDQLDGRTRALADAALLEPKGSDGTPGSLGTSDALVGDFVVELTDPGPTGRPVAGTDA